MVSGKSHSMNAQTRRILFLVFFISGFCSLVYQVVWTRMAFASFGIITPVLSVVLSVFMLGLSVGSWTGGRFISSWAVKTRISPAFFYAAAELLIGLGAFVVPKLFAAGVRILLSSGEANSIRYLVFSALVLAISILPWCIFMGTTFPFMMAFVRERDRESSKSFSYLYLANVLGAMGGTFLAAIVLVELLGFRHTLWVAAAGNFTAALISLWLGWQQQRSFTVVGPEPELATDSVASSQSPGSQGQMIKWILFSTGFAAMAMEVVWTRAFTPVLKTQVYSFALVIFVYLGATFLGSLAYRRGLRAGLVYSITDLIPLLAVAAFLPILANDNWLLFSWLSPFGTVRAIAVLASICPFCAILGYLTPRLIDEYSAGQPRAAGRAYAINVFGCILGPLFASYLLLPWLNDRYALILLGLPFLVFGFRKGKSLAHSRHRWTMGTAVAVLAWSVFVTTDFENFCSRTQKNTVIHRDYAASVISFGSERTDKLLLVNGIGMTVLTPVTKFMVHLPLAFHKDKPESALLICFGMGTTFRSALSWDIDVTAVELVPSVTEAFEFYHANARQCRENPKGHIVIDDGRRYLSRTREQYDVIVIDPPPPIEAAGSSLLHTTEFYELAKQHLKKNGILQAWFPGGVPRATAQAVIRSVERSFPYVRCFDSAEQYGVHILASMEPIETLSGEELAARLPVQAKKDLLEWSPAENLPGYLGLVVSQETPPEQVLSPNLGIQITDDRPFNEYFLLRQLGLSWR